MVGTGISSINSRNDKSKKCVCTSEIRMEFQVWDVFDVNHQRENSFHRKFFGNIPSLTGRLIWVLRGFFVGRCLKLTLPETNSLHLKMDGWNTRKFPFGAISAYFQGLRAVSFRQGILPKNKGQILETFIPSTVKSVL